MVALNLSRDAGLDSRREVAELQGIVTRMRDALAFYLDEDRRYVDAGMLESVGMRPAFAALGYRPRACAQHRRAASPFCRACYPSPPRPRVGESRGPGHVAKLERESQR